MSTTQSTSKHFRSKKALFSAMLLTACSYEGYSSNPDVTTTAIDIIEGATVNLNKNNAGAMFTVPHLESSNSDTTGTLNVQFTAASDTTTTAGHSAFIQSYDTYKGTINLDANSNNNAQALFMVDNFLGQSVDLNGLTLASAANPVVFNGTGNSSQNTITFTTFNTSVSGATIHAIGEKIDLGTNNLSGGGSCVFNLLKNKVSGSGSIPAELDLGHNSQISAITDITSTLSSNGFIYIEPTWDSSLNGGSGGYNSDASGDALMGITNAVNNAIQVGTGGAILGFHTANFSTPVIPGAGLLQNQNVIGKIKAFGGATVGINAAS